MYSQAKLPPGEREEEGCPDCLLAKVHVQFPRRGDHRCVQSNPGNTNPRDVLHPVEEVCVRSDYGHVHRERDVADAKGGESTAWPSGCNVATLEVAQCHIGNTEKILCPHIFPGGKYDD